MLIPHTPPSYLELRERLQELKLKAGLKALKSGTEIEDMDFEELSVMRRLSQGILPFYVKIGGPEARNDIRALAQLEVDAMIAPMIESPYALRKFIESLEALLPEKYYKTLLKMINVESAAAIEQLGRYFCSARNKPA